MSACNHCKGKGTYLVKETYSDGDTAIVAFQCNYCNGTGEVIDDHDAPADVFDIGGNDEDDD